MSLDDRLKCNCGLNLYENDMKHYPDCATTYKEAILTDLLEIIDEDWQGYIDAQNIDAASALNLTRDKVRKYCE